MKLRCEKDQEEFESGEEFCRHPEDYCKFRQACLIRFLALEKRAAAKGEEGRRSEFVGPDGSRG